MTMAARPSSRTRRPTITSSASRSPLSSPGHGGSGWSACRSTCSPAGQAQPDMRGRNCRLKQIFDPARPLAGGKVARVEPDPVHRRRDAQHVRRRQAGRAPQALVAVAGRGVDDLDHSIRNSGAPNSTSSAFSAQISTIVPADAGLDRVHHLHHLDQADDRVGLDLACRRPRTAPRRARARGRRCRASGASIVPPGAARSARGSGGGRRAALRTCSVKPASRSAARRAPTRR